MSTPETFSKLNTTPSDVGKEPSYGSPTFTQADLIGLLAPAQDEGGNTFPEDYTGIFDSQSRNYQFGIDDNMYGNTPGLSTGHRANTKIGRYLQHRKGEFIIPNI